MEPYTSRLLLGCGLAALGALAILVAAKPMGGTVDEETDRRILDQWLAENGGRS